MHGFLSKMGIFLSVSKLLGHVRKNWKVRYFVIKDDEMLYFQDSSITSLKGKVLLKNCTISVEDVKTFKRDKFRHSFIRTYQY